MDFVLEISQPHNSIEQTPNSLHRGIVLYHLTLPYLDPTWEWDYTGFVVVKA